MNSKHILDAARDHRIGSELLESHFGQQVFPVRCTISALALAIELYLKYFAVQTKDDFLRTHDLFVLYDDLSDSTKNLITNHWSGSSSFVDILNKSRDVFVEWRYIFEKQDVQFNLAVRDLRFVANALEAAVGKLPP